MADIKVISEQIRQQLAASHIDKADWRVSEVETRELNAEGGEFTLFRTLFDHSVLVNVIKDQKRGTIHGNDISEEGVKKAVQDAIVSSESAMADEAYDIAPKQEYEVISKGTKEPDMEKFFSRVEELLQDVKEQYPKIQMMLGVASHKKIRNVYANTNGTEIEVNDGYYYVMLEFAGNDGENTTGIDGIGVQMTDLDTRFIELGSFRKHLEDAVASLHQISVSEKFDDGTVILTPDCLATFMYYLLSNTISDKVILDNTSLWKDKLGEKVADERVTLSIKPSDARIVGGECVTADGYRTQDITVIENGILKSHQLSLYVSNKTGRACAKNTSGAYIFEPGKDALADMIKNVKKGLIVGGFSGGQPSTSGDFSGVAKNSFYIENGEIKGAVSETMINGNLMDILNHVEGISKEVVIDGGMVMPYMACSGIIVSGK